MVRSLRLVLSFPTAHSIILLQSVRLIHPAQLLLSVRLVRSVCLALSSFFDSFSLCDTIFLYDSFLFNVTVDTYDSLAKLPSGHLIFLKINVIIKISFSILGTIFKSDSLSNIATLFLIWFALRD